MVGFKQLRAPEGDGAEPAAAAERLPAFVGHEGDAAAALRAVTVGLIGCGAVGMPLALHLGRLGIGGLQLVDRGALKRQSLLTHPVTSAGTVGSSKVEVTGAGVLEVHPSTRVELFRGDVRELPFSAWRCDVFVLAVDNLAAELEVGQLALRAGAPLVQASVHGGSLVAQVRTFSEGAVCPACGFGAAEWALLAREVQFSCDGSARSEVLGPTRSPSSLCATAAAMAVHRVLAFTLGVGRPLVDEVIEYRGYGDAIVHTSLRRDPECPCEHRTWERMERDRVATVADLLRTAGVRMASLAVPGKRWVEQAVCDCGGTAAPARFVREGDGCGPCADCGEALQASPFHSRGEMTPEAAESHREVRLEDVGIGVADDVVVRAEAERVVCVAGVRPAAPVGGAA